MSLVILVVLLVVFFACLGRNSVPRRERLPVLSWGFRDLYGNVATGLRVFADLSRRYADRVERARKSAR